MKPTKQMSLKLLLLAALAANMSWGPLMRTLNETNMATEAKQSDGSGSDAAEDEEENKREIQRIENRLKVLKEKSDVASLPDDADKAPTRPRANAQDDAKKDEAETKAKPAPSHREKIMVADVCKQKYEFTFREFLKQGEKQTQIFVLREDEKQELFSITREGSIETVMKSDEVKSDLKDLITSSKGSKCEKKDEKVADNDEKDEKPAKEKKPRDEKRIARDIKECVIHSETHDKLDDTERMECLNERLAAVESEKDDPRRARDEVARKAKELINGPIKRQLTALLTSKDEDKVSAGEEALSEVQENISSLDLTDRDETLLKGNLNALKVAGRTSRVSNDFIEEAEQLNQELHAAMIQARIHRDDPWAMAEVNMVYGKHANLQAQIDMNLNPSYAELMYYQRNGMLNQTDLSPFLSPYNQLRREMSLMVDPKFMSINTNIGATSPSTIGSPNPMSITIPSSLGFDTPPDLFNMRRGLSTGRNFMLPQTAPQFPQLGNFGLSTGPGAFGRPQSMGQANVVIGGRTVNLPIYPQGPQSPLGPQGFQGPRRF